MSNAIYLVGDLNENKAEKILKELYQNREATTLFICSNGGDVGSADAIIDMMYLHGDVTTIGIGKCCSAGALILGHGRVRMATKNCAIMLHQYYIEDADYVNHLNNTSLFWKIQYDNSIKKLAERSKIPIKEFETLVQQTLWVTPNKAKKIGLIDKICTNLSNL